MTLPAHKLYQASVLHKSLAEHHGFKRRYHEGKANRARQPHILHNAHSKAAYHGDREESHRNLAESYGRLAGRQPEHAKSEYRKDALRGLGEPKSHAFKEAEARSRVANTREPLHRAEDFDSHARAMPRLTATDHATKAALHTALGTYHRFVSKRHQKKAMAESHRNDALSRHHKAESVRHYSTALKHSVTAGHHQGRVLQTHGPRTIFEAEQRTNRRFGDPRHRFDAEGAYNALRHS